MILPLKHLLYPMSFPTFKENDMSERYTRVFTYKKDTYAEGSPDIIVAGALLTDNIIGNSIA